MSLPSGGGAWPPANLAPVYDRFATWAAWWTGDPEELAYVYRAGADFVYDSTSRDRIAHHPSQFRGGVVGRLARWFWGEPVNFNQRSTKLHIPIAGDIAATSADLLFAEPPAVTTPDSKATQDRLGELIDDGVHATLLEVAEVCAALGSAYLRVCWDRDVNDRPWLSGVHADAAVPEWRWGKLTAVTFWEELSRTEKEVVRHLERHEPGYILHGVYKGTPSDLGKPIDLGAFPETQDLQPVIETGLSKLTAVFVPNMRPNRLWRSLPAASPLGRSDFFGAEGPMDALDECWSSWMRDIRLGKARLVVPETYLESLGKGQGSRFDPTREVYEGLNMLGAPGQNQITQTQFAIRVQEHKETAYELMTRIVSAAGYEGQTFGLQGDNTRPLTATEVAARERKSYTTRSRKINYWRTPLADIIETLLMVDASVFRSGVDPVKPNLEWGDGVSEDPTTVAQTAQLLHAAEAASTDTLVRLVHPDWDDDQVAAEVTRIQAQQQPTIVPGLGDGMGSTGPGTPADLLPPDQQPMDAAAYGG